MEELVCTSSDEYVAKAIDLGRNPEKLAHYKQKLADALPTCTLFDTPKLVRSLEDLYHEVYRDYENGFVHHPDMTNLDIYHEVGVNLDHENTEFMVAKDYEEQYRRALTYRDSFSRLPYDKRFWPKPE